MRFGKRQIRYRLLSVDPGTECYCISYRGGERVHSFSSMSAADVHVAAARKTTARLEVANKS